MRKIIIQSIFGMVSLFGFEVNTHQAITRCALTEECGMKKVSNLENFVKNTELNTTEAIYKNEIFEKYDTKYEKYVSKDETDFKNWDINITSNYLGMIEAGSVLVDSTYHNEDHKPLYLEDLDGADGRFNNHFYTVQFNSRNLCKPFQYTIFFFLQTFLPENMLSEKALCGGYGKRTDNISWVFDENIELGLERVNDYGLEDAFEYMKKSFEGNETSRRKYQAKLFVSLGMMSHMLQDLHSPAHVRNGSHPKGDYLEIYGRYDGGFNLRNGEMNPNNELEIEDAIRNFDMPSYLNGMNFKSLEDVYYKEATWVSENFFSESRNASEQGHTQTGQGLEFNNQKDQDTIFHDLNTHLSKSETYEEEANSKWNFIKTNGNASDIYGDINSLYNSVAFIEKGLFFLDEHIVVPKEYVVEKDATNQYVLSTPTSDTDYLKADITALKHTAINVIPRAVASTQAMLNFFFRGQIKASTVYSRAIWVYNVSDTTNISDTSLLTLKAGGKFYFYYMNDDNISKPIATEENGKAKPFILEEDFLVNSSKIFILNNIVSPPSDDIFAGKNIDGETRWIVMYEGDIGEDLGGSNNFSYGMKGMSVDIALDRFRRGETNETVIDYANNLHWQDTDDELIYSWDYANNYCNTLVLAGYDNWRLPLETELKSILKPKSILNPSSYVYKNYFKYLLPYGYWTLNYSDNYPSENTVTVVSFDHGGSLEIHISSYMNRRCVRSTY